MADIALTDITQEQYDAAERIIIDLIRSAYPQLDLRKGTVLRETTIRPDASLNALNIARVEQLRRIISLQTMLEDGTATPDEVNAILANFNMIQQAGVAATGLVRVKVNAARTYTLAAGFTFSTVAGLQYSLPSLTVAKQDATPANGEVELYTGSDGGYYFVVPVMAVAAGDQYNIAAGTALEPTTQLYGYISSAAYSNFTSGQNAESLANAINRIPAAVSHRGLTNRTAIEAQLRARFDGTAVSIQALNVQGYGDAAQRRDKHNIFGVAVGGRADVYVRTFVAPTVTVLEKTGNRIATGTYQFSIAAAESPGFYAVRSITDREGVALSSYQFTETRVPSAASIDATWHDIDPANGIVETAYSVFQQATITVTGVPDAGPTHVFKVELYSSPGLQDLQDYVDDPAVRNVAADFMVRCPMICLVTMTANVYYPKTHAVSISTLTSNLAAYINSRSFVQRLTRSELTSVLLQSGATRVELGQQGMALTGRVRDAAGNWHDLAGDALNIGDIADGTNMLTQDTVVFGAEVQNIHLTGIPE